MKKYITLILASALMLTSISCGSGSSDSKTTTASDNESVPAETTTGKYDPGLPDRNFGGRTFTFALRGVEGDPYQWNGTDILADEENGEALNDAVYKRNAFMRDTYNVIIDGIFCGGTSTSTSGSEMSSFITKSIMSGDSEFDAILTSPYDSIGYAANDYLLDLNTLDYLDLTRDYWDQNANKSLAMNGHIYITTGELTYIDNKATQILAFNKNMVDMYNVDDPYETVRSGKWTIDKMIENSKLVSNDLNGDGAMDENDSYGLSYWQDAAFSFTACSGITYGKIVSGEPQLTFYSEKTVDLWSKMISYISSDLAFSRNEYINKYASNVEMMKEMLENDQALYTWMVITEVITLRSSDADFGILPLPKYDENQEDYISNPHAFGHTMLTVPVTTANPEETGFILEAFCAKSAEIVTPAFYDITLIGKSIRDDESAEMLNIIFNNKVYDIGAFFMWGGLPDKVMQAWNSKDENIASLYAKYEAAALEDVAKTKEIFNK